MIGEQIIVDKAEYYKLVKNTFKLEHILRAYSLEPKIGENFTLNIYLKSISEEMEKQNVSNT